MDQEAEEAADNQMGLEEEVRRTAFLHPEAYQEVVVLVDRGAPAEAACCHQDNRAFVTPNVGNEARSG